MVITHRRAFLQENPPERAPHSAGSVRRDHRKGTWQALCTPRYIGCQFLQHTHTFTEEMKLAVDSQVDQACAETLLKDRGHGTEGAEDAVRSGGAVVAQQ